MSQYKVYPAYKDSGVEWIGQVPEHWQLRKVAWDLVMSIGWTPDTKNRRYYGGDYNWVSIADLTKNRINETGQKITQLAVDEMKGSQAPAGSLLFSYKLTIGMVALLDQPAYTNEAIAAFYPNKKINMNFWKYAVVVILPRYSRKNIYNSDLLNQELMNSARFYAPSYDEQATIAAALDRETARIDALVEKKTRFIELLKEKRQALITHAVTKGLDPNAKMKDSGVEWIGQVPEHWQLRKVAWDLVMSIGWTPDTKNRRYYGGDYNWVSIADLTKNRVNETGQKITQLAVDEMKGSQAPAGSLLFSYKLTIGMVALLDQPAYTNEAIAAFYPNKKINMNFWKYAVVVILPRYSRKNIYNSDLLNQELMNSARFYAPSYDEQATIAATLDRETARIYALIGKAEQSITLLKERRAAFITAAVTGQIDLRGEQ
jgi:type I restriction enzyme S subunit